MKGRLIYFIIFILFLSEMFCTILYCKESEVLEKVLCKYFDQTNLP